MQDETDELRRRLQDVIDLLDLCGVATHDENKRPLSEAERVTLLAVRAGAKPTDGTPVPPSET